jgi:tetratricopeptide (TPR) repeat protein
MRIAIAAPAPLGLTESPQVEDEIDRLVAAWRGAGLQSSLHFIIPASPRTIAESRADVLHLAAHASRQSLQLEDAIGLPAPTDIDVVVDAVATMRPTLVVLNGCDTERLARRVHGRNLGCWLIGHEGYLGNTVAATFAESLSDGLASGTDVDSAFETAFACVSSRFGDSGYVLFPGRSKLPKPVQGECRVQGFIAYKSRIRHARLADVFQPTLVAGSRYCLGDASSVLNVHGVPGSGVTTMLQAIAGRMAFTFESVIQVQGQEIQAAFKAPVAPAESRRSERVLVCFDNADVLGPADLETQIKAIRQTYGSGSTYLIVGTQVRLEHASVDSALLVPPLSEHDVRQMAASLLPVHQAEIVVGILQAYQPVHSSAVMSAIDLIRADVPIARVKHWLDHGQDDERWLRMISRWQSHPAVRLLLRALSLAGSPVRLTALEQAFAFAAPDSLPAGRSASSVFSSTYALMRANGIVVELPAPHESGSVLAASTADLRRAVAMVWKRPSATETADLLNGLIAAMEGMRLDRTLAGSHDAKWIAVVLKEATKHSLHDAVVQVGGRLIDRTSAFRRSADRSAILMLAEAVLASAEQLQEWAVAAQGSLVAGEGYYGKGDLAAAASHFSRCLNYPDDERHTAGDRLRAHRALGQVQYRRGDFLQAISEYEAAEGYVAQADASFVATLRQHHAKALFRLNRVVEAEAKLRLVLEFREDQDDLHALAKAQHELGRVLRAVGRLEEARDLFNRALVSAVASDFVRFLPAPLYELFLMEFDVEGRDAEVYASRCHAAAEESGDELWLALSAVARGMLAFRRGSYRDAGTFFQRALSKADANGLDAVRDDIRRFVARSVQGSSTTDGHVLPPGAVALVAATWGLSEEKAAKALQYMREPARILSADIVFESKSATRHRSWSSHRWNCDCSLFQSGNVCTHVVALSLYQTNPFGVLSELREASLTVTAPPDGPGR